MSANQITHGAGGSVAAIDVDALARRYGEVRMWTARLCEPLSAEDMVVQSMTDASPAKWHLGHTTWFFEAFALDRFAKGYRRFDDRFAYLFNSYYNAMGERVARGSRGMITRPGVDETLAYREHVDRAMVSLIEGAGADERSELAEIVEIGLQHEQQHQELLLTDIKHLLSSNPLRPAYRDLGVGDSTVGTAMGWAEFDAGIRWIGHEGEGFAYDNEGPRHRVFLEPYALADRLLTNEEYVAFVEDDGYRRSDLWLDEGWSLVQAEGWTAPLYWRKDGDRWLEFTLAGERRLDPNKPVAHLSFFEADAVARWMGARLPTEFEWEAACAEAPIAGNFVESEMLHPIAAGTPVNGMLRQAFGDLWEWTRSDYGPYPGYAPPSGALGEYNG
ncbi:MAG: ergothioneine biosynthesis protein EgtB, partial [Planctomycetota bacterium]|nr:ergothioneine biosynthesis protein EgtB [Planctomycetota bacterium]